MVKMVDLTEKTLEDALVRMNKRHGSGTIALDSRGLMCWNIRNSDRWLQTFTDKWEEVFKPTGPW